MNCSNIEDIVIEEKLGEGWKSNVFAGYFHGRKVAVKVVFYSEEQSESCTEDHQESWFCFDEPRVEILYEISLHHQLNHPSIVRMLGYCARDPDNWPIRDDPVVKNGILSVSDFGELFDKEAERNFTASLAISLELLDMMDYFVNSPIGPVVFDDSWSDNLRLVDGHLKITDIESSWSTEPRCEDSDDCEYDVECVEGECKGSNAKTMRDYTQRYIRPWLAPNNSPKYKRELKTINNLLDDEFVTFTQLVNVIQELKNKVLEEM